MLTILKSNDSQQIDECLNEVHPVDVARELESLEDFELIEYLAVLPDDFLVEIIEAVDEDYQSRIVDLLSFERISRLFKLMSTDIIVDILGNLSVGTRKKYLRLMKESEQLDINHLLSYPPSSAGGIMTTEFITLRDYWTVEKAFQKIREISPNTEMIDTLFISNSRNVVVGWLPIRDLFLVDLKTALEAVMDPNVIVVTPEMDQEEVAKISVKYDLSVIPVVSPQRILIGIITADDIMEVLQEEHKEDMLRMSGVNEDENLDDSFLESLKQRLPWLVVNLFTAFLASFVVGLFEGTISQVASLAAAMTIITGMGGNSASQTLALVIQGIALDDINLDSDRKYILKELGLGLANGLITGIIAGIVLYVPYENIYLSLIVVLAMMFNLLNGAFFGYFIPLMLKKIKIDPALASSIFITTATDVLGFFVFLSLANLFLPYLKL